MSFDDLTILNLNAIDLPQFDHEEIEAIHADADLETLAFNIIVRSIKDIQNPKFTPKYTQADYEADIEGILAWITTDSFSAVCQVAGLNPYFVTRIIEKLCGLTPDFEVVAELRQMLDDRESNRFGRGASGVDEDLEEKRWS